MKRNLTVKEIELPRKNIRNRRASAILLSGLWLKDAGFAPGDKVELSVQNNRIVITKGGEE